MKLLPVITSTFLIFCLAACDNDFQDRIYTSTDPDDCSRLRFVCIAGQQAFSDATGCGCETIDRDALMREPGNDRSRDPYYDQDPFLTPPDSSPSPQPYNPSNSDDQIRSDEDSLNRNLDEIQNQRLENSH